MKLSTYSKLRENLKVYNKTCQPKADFLAKHSNKAETDRNFRTFSLKSYFDVECNDSELN